LVDFVFDVVEELIGGFDVDFGDFVVEFDVFFE